MILGSWWRGCVFARAEMRKVLPPITGRGARVPGEVTETIPKHWTDVLKRREKVRGMKRASLTRVQGRVPLAGQEPLRWMPLTRTSLRGEKGKQKGAYHQHPPIFERKRSPCAGTWCHHLLRSVIRPILYLSISSPRFFPSSSPPFTKTARDRPPTVFSTLISRSSSPLSWSSL